MLKNNTATLIIECIPGIVITASRMTFVSMNIILCVINLYFIHKILAWINLAFVSFPYRWEVDQKSTRHWVVFEMMYTRQKKSILLFASPYSRFNSDIHLHLSLLCCIIDVFSLLVRTRANF
jgi:hypothetical protein